jgi:hypothetical protein
MGILLFSSVLAQHVPNGGFEAWETTTLYENPVDWPTANQQTFMQEIQLVTKSEDAYSGDYALRMETTIIDEDTIVGYAFTLGNVYDIVNDTFQFVGGFPVSAAPDSIFGHYKYDIAPDDTALVLVSFKKDGELLAQNVFGLTGTQSEYIKIGFELQTMAETPDTCMLALACSNPDRPKYGSVLQVDSIWFGDLPDVIPNADFEDWQETSYTDPVSWVSSNLFGTVFGGSTSTVTATTDARSGTYAIRIEVAEVNVPSDTLETRPLGFAISYGDEFNLFQDLPRFPVDFNPYELTGYYKFDPAVDDTGTVTVILHDDLDNHDYFGNILTQVDTFTRFTVPLDYSGAGTVTDVSIILSCSMEFLGDTSDADIGSVLIVDDLYLADRCDTLYTFEIESVTQATCDDPAEIDAGYGWLQYDWSNDSTTQQITVEVTTDHYISVTVTDTSYGCMYTDSVQLIAPTGCIESIEEMTGKAPSLAVYPNPGSGIYNLDFKNIDPGKYTIEVLSITGQRIDRSILSATRDHTSYKLDISTYPQGLYLLRVSGNEFKYVERLIIE